jgi:pimeloyl-ACP methyl ester carboxylesterase
MPRRYASLDEAVKRMQEENAHLSEEQARHLTVHGTNQNEDGTYSWKFDNYVRGFSPYTFNRDEAQSLWSRIACPVLLVRGADSWAGDPASDGRLAAFQKARVVTIQDAGHWAHHDQLDVFLAHAREFLDEA